MTPAALFRLLSSYSRTIGALVADSLLRFRKLTALAVTGLLGGLVTKVAAIGATAYFAKLLEEDKPVTFLGVTVNPESAPVIVAGCVIIVTCLAVSAALTYLGGSRTITMRRTYQDFCAARAFSLLASNYIVMPGASERRSDLATARQIARADSSFCARMVMLTLRLVTPILTAIIALAVLLYLDPLPTLAMLALLTLTGIFHYKASLAGANSSRTMEELSQDAGLQFHGRMEALSERPEPDPDEESRLNADLFRDGVHKRFLDARDTRVRALYVSQLAAELGTAMAVLLLLVVIAIRLTKGDATWPALVIYLAALWNGMSSLQMIGQGLTGINRFYPHLLRYQEFLRVMTAPKPEPVQLDRYVVRVTSPAPLDGTRERAEIRAPCRVFLLSGTNVNRYTVGGLIDSMLAPSRKSVSAVLSDLWFIPRRPRWHTPEEMAHRVGMDAGVLRRELAQLLGDAGCTALAEAAQPSFNGAEAPPISPRHARALDAALGLLVACRTGRRWVIADESSLAPIPAKAVVPILETMEHAIVVIVGDGDADIERYDVDLVVSTADGRVRGIGDQEQGVAWKAWHKRERSASAALGDDAEDESLIE